MTIKKKNIYWRKVFKLSASFLVAILILNSCKKEITTIGNDINPNGLNIVSQDTFTVITKSVNQALLKSDETSVNLLGAINDPELGTIDCGIVTQLRLSSESPDFGNVSDIQVDSIVLSFVFSDRKHYGNLKDLSFEVYEIEELLDRDNEDYYTNSLITKKGNNLILNGSEIVQPNPDADVILGTDTLSPMIRLNLDPNFGKYLIDNSNEMSSNSDFIKFFKGLYVKVEEASGLALGEGTVLYLSLEDALSNLVLYYSTANVSKTYTLNINNNCARFNKIDINNTGYPAESILENIENAQEKFYMQGSSVRPEFQFPFISDLSAKKIIINKAELIVPVQDIESNPFKVSNGLFIGRIIDESGTTFTYDYPSFENSSEYDEENKVFKFNLTRDLQKVLAGEIKDKGYRIYSTNFFGSSIERIIFNGPKGLAEEKTKLLITYTEY